MTTRPLRAMATVLVLMAAVSADALETQWFEAEIPRDSNNAGGNITSPLVIGDHSAASGGSYVGVESGHKNIVQAPTPGRSCIVFAITETANYRVWARVIAPTDGDDSFWFRMDSGPWIAWNQIKLGTSWHWDFVHDNSAPSQPIVFPLSEGDHAFCIAYREDGALVDLFVVSNDPDFNPAAPTSGLPPVAPAQIDATPGKGLVLLSWTNVPGATGYFLERRDAVPDAPFIRIASLSGVQHSTSDINVVGDHCYQVVARNAAGVGPAAPEVCAAPIAELRYPAPWWLVTQTPPLVGQGLIAVEPGNNSTSAPPATGWARLDFRTATAWRVKVWGRAVAPDTSSDSFWVRVNRGPWVNWNNLKPAGPCGWEDVHNSAAGGASLVFDLRAGSNTIELAYREDGAEIHRVFVTDDLSSTPPVSCYE